MPVFLNVSALIKKMKLFFYLLVVVFLISTTGILYIFNFYQQTAANQAKYQEQFRTYTIEGNIPDIDVRLKTYTDTNKKALQRVYVQLQNGSDSIVANYFGNAAATQKVLFGRYFDNGDSKQILVPQKNYTESNICGIGDKYLLGGESFEIVGIGNTPYYEVPYNVIPNRDSIKSVFVVSRKSLSDSDKENFAAALRKAFQTEKVILPTAKNAVNLRYTLDMFIVFALTFTGVLNVSFLYLSILSKRKKQQMVFYILGCGRFRLYAIYISEMLLLTSLLFAVSCLITQIILFPVLRIMDAYYTLLLTAGDYLFLYIVYIIIILFLLVLQSIKYSRKTPFALYRRS